MTQVEIYHSLGRHVSIDTVLSEGLKSRRKLIEEGTLEPTSQILFPDQNEVIYFRWMKPEFARGLGSQWVSMEVDSENTRVFNAEFRYDVNRSLYLSSEMSLAELIDKKQRGEKLKGSVPGKFVVYNPTTAEPTLVDFDDSRISDRHWAYSNEVLLRREAIPASQFKDHHT